MRFGIWIAGTIVRRAGLVKYRLFQMRSFHYYRHNIGIPMSRLTFEFILENNALRSWVRDLMEVKPLREATSIGRIPRALHIACGNGNPTKLIRRRFNIGRITAFDRDPVQIDIARKKYAGEPIDFSVGDVRSINIPDGAFDAVFDLADLHNFADWKKAVQKIRRALKPGGLFILEELSQETFTHAAGKLFKALTEHPYDSMLTVRDFKEYIGESGFEILNFRELCPLGLLKYFLLIARKE
jgi:ubiquinone/menaquinone biosynthesis C-methylase UbiE